MLSIENIIIDCIYMIVSIVIAHAYSNFIGDKNVFGFVSLRVFLIINIVIKNSTKSAAVKKVFVLIFYEIIIKRNHS